MLHTYNLFEVAVKLCIQNGQNFAGILSRQQNIYDLGLVAVIVDFVVNMHVRCYCDCGNGPAATVVAGQRTVLATVVYEAKKR